MKTFIFNDFILEVGDIKYELTEEPDYFIFKFTISGTHYEIIQHTNLGNRLLIWNDEYYSKDLPLNTNTSYFIPSQVKITWKTK